MTLGSLNAIYIITRRIKIHKPNKQVITLAALWLYELPAYEFEDEVQVRLIQIHRLHSDEDYKGH